MKTLITKWKEQVARWMFNLEVSVYVHGTNKRYTPRFLRRILAGTRYHKVWMLGRITAQPNPQTFLQEWFRFWKRKIERKLFWFAVEHPILWRFL